MCFAQTQKKEAETSMQEAKSYKDNSETELKELKSSLKEIQSQLQALTAENITLTAAELRSRQDLQQREAALLEVQSETLGRMRAIKNSADLLILYRTGHCANFGQR